MRTYQVFAGPVMGEPYKATDSLREAALAWRELDVQGVRATIIDMKARVYIEGEDVRDLWDDGWEE